MAFAIKQLIKMLIQNIILPVIYSYHRRQPVRPGLIVFAASHGTEIPFSMQYAYQEAVRTGNDIKVFVEDYDNMSFTKVFKSMVLFMKLYAVAEYIFICDYYLPISSCRKRPETTVVQLWHSGGVMKKMGYDTTEDIPSYYKGNMFGNYSLVSVSSEVCADIIAHAMQLSREKVKPLGLSRTDLYYDENFLQECRKEFYQKYPDAAGKKIILWAPTFRGNAANPYLTGAEEIYQLFEQHKDTWYGIIKVHPHLDKVKQTSDCEMPTEKLLGIADMMITDFSSIMFDYQLFRKPCLLYIPDFETYSKNRGIYLKEAEIPFPVVKVKNALDEAVLSCMKTYDPQDYEEDCEKYMGACDGQATRRIFREIGIY